MEEKFDNILTGKCVTCIIQLEVYYLSDTVWGNVSNR